MSRTRLVALDVDGTLMSYDGVISPQVRALVRELDEAGVHVVLSTGRAVHSAPRWPSTSGSPRAGSCARTGR